MAEQLNDRESSGLADKLMQYLPARFRPGTAVVPVVRLSGVIGAVTPLRPGMTLATVSRGLERAFSTRNAKAVALVINSPGGSPVQSRQIYLRIKQLAAEKKLPVLVFVEDVAASGGYMIACAGDEIICDPSSILGSIGVVGGSFGFQEAIKRLGIERRLYTAGAHKAMLDPFLPENPDDVAKLKALQREIHQIFIALVKESRGARLKGLRRHPVHGRILGRREFDRAGARRQHRRSPLNSSCPLWREGSHPRDCPADRSALQPFGPEIARRGAAFGHGINGRPAGRPDLGGRDARDLGEIRVLDGAPPRHLVPRRLEAEPIAARPGLSKNARGG
ncbi:signal peptide peptidase SppA [Bradyrhizobium sp. F1.13.1]